MEGTDSYNETMFCFTNNIPQSDGGTHLDGSRAALTRTVNAYATDSGSGRRQYSRAFSHGCHRRSRLHTRVGDAEGRCFG
jgi:DNA gyrase/topoisomerase IV subunit B